MDNSVDRSREEARLGMGKAIMLWILFFLISFELGYPTLNRYDQRELGPDWQGYYNVVLHQDSLDDYPYCFRVLVPEIARPFYLLARGRVGSWNPVSFGLLVSNSLFCATATFLFLLIGLRVMRDLPVALLACTLYLLNYVVHELWLSGMVDSSVACFMMALILAMMSDRWWLLPLIGIPGSLAKEEFLAFSTMFAATWWISMRQPARTYRQLGWLAALGCTCTATLMVVHWKVAGLIVSPLAMATSMGTEGNYALKFLRQFTDQEFWYAFVWLLPLGVIRLNRFPRPWVAASGATALLALCLGAYLESLGGICRPLFSVIGPLLTLSAATFITDWPGGDHSRSGRGVEAPPLRIP
jgi:hypothetical protein